MIRRFAIAVLFTFAATVLLVEGLLRWLDPWGALAYFDDLAAIYANFQDDEARGFIFKPGIHTFSHWTATVLPGGLRDVPNSGNGPCRIVFLGDSVTFAWGVDDRDTWVNLVARELPDVRVLNAGVPGYNVSDVTRTRRAVQGDLYVYLVIDNDNGEDKLNWRDYRRLAGSAIGQYRYALHYWSLDKRVPPITPIPAFDQIVNDQNVVTVVFDIRGSPLGFTQNGLPQAVAERYKVAVIPAYTTSVSRLDAHPDKHGNREIAQAMLPIVKEAVQNRCTAVF